MSASLISRRRLLEGGGALIVAATMPAPAIAENAHAFPHTLDPNAVDAYFAVHQDGTVTLYCGKVDLGTGLRIAIPQMAAEELGIGLDKISLIEGDTGLTPDQGSTAGSTGVARGGVQIRQAAATAREALIRMASERLGLPASELEASDGEVRSRKGGTGIGFSSLIGPRQFALKLDPKVPLRNPDDYKLVGKPLPRPDIPAKIAGSHAYLHNFKLDGMLHGRAVRPQAVSAKLLDVDEGSISHIPGAHIVRLADFLGVVAEDEWDAIWRGGLKPALLP